MAIEGPRKSEKEMGRIKSSQDEEKKCHLLDILSSISDFLDQYEMDNEDEDEDEVEDGNDTSQSSSLSSPLFINNCFHQREIATGAGTVARNLGLEKYLQFVKADRCI